MAWRKMGVWIAVTERGQVLSLEIQRGTEVVRTRICETLVQAGLMS